MKFRKLISAVTSIALSFSVLSGLNFVKPEKNITAEAAASSWKFDFGNGGTASGFTGVSASEGYSASKGYGFAEPSANRCFSGDNALLRHYQAHQIQRAEALRVAWGKLP